MPLTKRAVEDIEPNTILWDAGKGSVAGFGVRRQKSARVFILKYSQAGRGRWHTIGKFGAPWTVDQARTEAKRVLGEIAGGRDPGRQRRQAAAAGVSVSEFCDS